MRVIIVRRYRNASISMDVYADGVVSGLKSVRPDWEIVELSPRFDSSVINQDESVKKSFWLTGIQKYYERYWRYPHSLKDQEADIFHVIDHSEGHLNFWLKKYRKKNVITCHDLINLVQPETFEGRARLPRVSMLVWKNSVKSMKNADHIISVSSHTKKDIINSLGIDEQEISVIPNAVDPIFHTIDPELAAQFRTQQGLGKDKFCLLNVGSNHSRKNVITVLKILPILKSQGMPVHFWKVGKDFTEEQLEFITENHLEVDITYLGQPSLNDLIKIYNSADVLVAPSWYEGFGLTILEAMACGLAVITSNVTSLPEVAGDAAILVDPLDVKTIAEELKNLYYNRECLQNLVEKGLKRAAQFTWENTAEQVAQIYEKVINSVKLT